MTVQKALDVSGTGSTVEEAVQEALDRAESTVEGITSFRVGEISGAVEDGRIVYRVEVRIWFTLLERLHG